MINGGMVGESPFAGVEKGLLVKDCDTIAYFVVEFGAVGEQRVCGEGAKPGRAGDCFGRIVKQGGEGHGVET